MATASAYRGPGGGLWGVSCLRREGGFPAHCGILPRPAYGEHPAQRARLEEIRANLHGRIAEAEREGWLGEVDGLKVSLAGAGDKLDQIDAALRRQATTVQRGMPAFPGIVPHSIPANR